MRTDSFKQGQKVVLQQVARLLTEGRYVQPSEEKVISPKGRDLRRKPEKDPR